MDIYVCLGAASIFIVVGLLGLYAFATSEAVTLLRKRKARAGGKLVEALLGFPTEEHVKNVCRPGQSGKTCYYLTMGSDGWSCAKSSSLRQVIDERVASGTMNAKADNCSGLLGFIIEHQQELVGKKVEYEESMPSHKSIGLLKRVEAKNGNFFIFWDDDGEKDNSTNVKYLNIIVNPQSITFGVTGLGSFAGRTTILL